MRELLPYRARRMIATLRERREAGRALRRARGNTEPIIVLGNQKSGTTVVAALLGAAADLQATLDLQSEVARPTLHRVRLGELSFEEVVASCGPDFAAPLIKEPNLTFYVDELDRFFDAPRYVFVVRDPRDNVRSILDRLSISGKARALSDAAWAEMPPGWRWILDNAWQGIPAEDHVESLARRWVRAADVYFDNRDRMRLVRYEDFLADKTGTITRLAEDLGVSAGRPIDHLVDVQYQPKGDRDVSWDEFFGPGNRERIERICRARMRDLGYDA